jgi:hypothetical protein
LTVVVVVSTIIVVVSTIIVVVSAIIVAVSAIVTTFLDPFRVDLFTRAIFITVADLLTDSTNVSISLEITTCIPSVRRRSYPVRRINLSSAVVRGTPISLYRVPPSTGIERAAAGGPLARNVRTGTCTGGPSLCPRVLHQSHRDETTRKANEQSHFS